MSLLAKGRFHSILEGIGLLLFPLVCPSCRRYIGHAGDWPLCRECLDRIEPVPPPLCALCGRSSERTPCDFCARHPDLGPDLFIRSAALYAGPVRDAILAAKQPQREDMASRLGRALRPDLLRLIGEEPPERFRLAPVPLHPDRLRRRGFNLPGLMAETLRAECGVPLRPDWLVRTKDTPSQVGRSVADRWANVAEAFAVPPGKKPEGRIILIDDVSTSGATLKAAAAPFRLLGLEVRALSLARA